MLENYILNNDSSKDIDIVVVGNGVNFAKKVAAKIGLDPNSNIQIFKNLRNQLCSNIMA